MVIARHAAPTTGRGAEQHIGERIIGDDCPSRLPSCDSRTRSIVFSRSGGNNSHSGALRNHIAAGQLVAAGRDNRFSAIILTLNMD